MSASRKPTVWFPAVRAGTGSDVFTETLAAELQKRGQRAAITWLPQRAEYAPWTVAVPRPPAWVDVVHVNSWLHPRFIPQRLPVVATLHHSVHDPALLPYKGLLRAVYHDRWIAPIERAVLRRADRVVAVSRFAAASARARLLERAIEVIPNGVDVERFRPPDARMLHRPFRLLFLGSWMARKGVNLLAPIMRELGDSFELRYTGGSAAGAARAGMPANMHDIGRLHGHAAVLAALHAADALLFPSRSEGLPLSVLEAMACGLPVIATRGSSLVEVVEDGGTGILCPQDDVAAFAAAARSLACAPDRYAALSRQAAARARDEFGIAGMVEAYRDIYRALVTAVNA